MTRARSFLMLASGLAAACATQHDSAEPTAIVVHTYSAPGLGSDGSVNSYFLETEHGIVVVDGLRTLHEGNEALTSLQTLGKPIEALILTHPHPDHVGGLGVFASASPAGTPVYGSAATQDEIVADRHGYFALSASSMTGDFPAVPQAPNTIVSDGQRVTVDGVEILFAELGAGESVSTTVVIVPSARTAFTGDLTSDRMTPYLVEGRSALWLAQLDALAIALQDVRRVYPGHGSDGTPGDAIAQQRSYLTTFRSLVDQNRTPTGEVDAAGRAAIASGLKTNFDGYPPVATIPDLQNKNIDAVAKELAGQ